MTGLMISILSANTSKRIGAVTNSLCESRHLPQVPQIQFVEFHASTELTLVHLEHFSCLSEGKRGTFWKNVRKPAECFAVTYLVSSISIPGKATAFKMNAGSRNCGVCKNINALHIEYITIGEVSCYEATG